MTFSIHEKIGLAQIFGEKVQALPRDVFAQIIDRNKADGPESNVCHTHDFCDANMLMLEAWQEMFGDAPDLDNDDHLAAWNDAWAIAKAAGFFA